MSEELLTPQQDEPHDQEYAREEILGQFKVLASRLIEPAVRHDETWRRTIYEVTPEQTVKLHEQMMNNSLGEFIEGHRDTNNGFEYRSDNPSMAYVIADESGIRGSNTQIDLILNFLYEGPKGFNDIRIKIRAGKPTVRSFVFSDIFVETGYEGHDFFDKEANTAQLKALYDVFNQYSQEENRIVEEEGEPFEELKRHIVWLDGQTGQRMFYNPESKNWEVPLDDR